MGRSVDLDDVIDAAAVAALLGLSEARSVATYRGRFPDFPKPILMSSGGRCQYWLRDEIEAWQRERQQQTR